MVVVFESIYSSDGSIAPVNDIIDVCTQYGALSYCDDANGFMIYGAPHLPFYAEFNALRRATFVMVSFSKAIGLEGDAISGPSEWVGAFEVLSGTSLFTAAIQPPTVSTIHRVIEHLEATPEVMRNYLAKSARFRGALLADGFKLNPDPSYIASVLIGDDAKAEAVRRSLLEQGFCVPVFRYPAVKPNKAVMRLILNDRHTDDDLASFLDALKRSRATYRF